MIRKTHSRYPGCIHVIFELPAWLWADHIHVVGDLNGWSHTATPMVQGRDGIWRAEADLPVGSIHEFRYLVDDYWLTDYHADSYKLNRFGSVNSVINATLPAASLQVERLSSHVWENNKYAPQQARKAAQRRSWGKRRLTSSRRSLRLARRLPAQRSVRSNSLLRLSAQQSE